MVADRETHRMRYAIARTTNAPNAPNAVALTVTQIAPYRELRLFLMSSTTGDATDEE